MKRSLKNNWPIKLASVLAASAIWFLIKQHIGNDSTLRFAGYEAEGQRMRTQNDRDQIKLQEVLEHAIEIQKRLNENLLTNAPKATPVTEPAAPAPSPNPTPPNP